MNNELEFIYSEFKMKCSKCEKETKFWSYIDNPIKCLRCKIKELENLAREDERQKIVEMQPQYMIKKNNNHPDLYNKWVIAIEDITNQSQDAVKSTPQDGSKTTGSDKTLLDISNERQKLAKEIFDELDGNCYYSWDGTQIFSMKYSNYKELKQKYLGVKE